MECHEILILHHVEDRLCHLRNRNIRVSKAEVIYILPAVNSSHSFPFLEHCADRGIICHKWFHFF